MRKQRAYATGFLIITCLVLAGCRGEPAIVKEVPVYPGAEEYSYPADGPGRFELPRYSTADSTAIVADWYRERLKDEKGFSETKAAVSEGEIIMFEYRYNTSTKIVALTKGRDSLEGKTVIEIRTVLNT